MTNSQPDSPEDWKDGETLVQFLSKLQFNAAKWAYMKLHGALDEEDAAAKLFADRQMKAAKIEEYYTNKFLKRETELLDALYWMYTQYCGKGHDFMGAGEDASELLENAGYIKVDPAGVIMVDNGDSQEQAIKQLGKRGKDNE